MISVKVDFSLSLESAGRGEGATAGTSFPFYLTALIVEYLHIFFCFSFVLTLTNTLKLCLNCIAHFKPFCVILKRNQLIKAFCFPIVQKYQNLKQLRYPLPIQLL